jgi:hypothetical protein
MQAARYDGAHALSFGTHPKGPAGHIRDGDDGLLFIAL